MKLVKSSVSIKYLRHLIFTHKTLCGAHSHFLYKHTRKSTLLDIPPLAHYYIFKCTVLSVLFGNGVYFFYTQIV